MKKTVDLDFERQLKDYRLTTAEIIYGLPDHPHLVQEFIWQRLDIAPKFPVLKKFLIFWERNLAGPLREVRVASVGIIQPADWRNVDAEFRLH